MTKEYIIFFVAFFLAVTASIYKDWDDKRKH